MKLGKISDIVRGSSPRPKGDPRYYNGPVPRLMLADLTRDGKIAFPKIDSLTLEGAKKSRPMKKGDIIIAVSGDPGRCCILGKDACIHDGFVGVRNLDTKKCNPEFLYYYLNFFKRRTGKEAVGAIFKNLTTTQIKDIRIPDLSLPDQVRIATLLSRAEELIGQRRESLRLLDELVKGVFLEMFGEEKKEWKKMLFEKVADIQSGQVDPREKPYSDMIHVGGVNIESGTGKLINLKKAKELKLISGKYLFTESDILYSKIRPKLDKVATPDFSGICSADMYPISPKEGIVEKEYLKSIFHSQKFLAYANKHSGRTNIPKINRKALNAFKLTVPPFPLQQKFATTVHRIEALKKKYEASLSELVNLYGSLSQRAFRGELNLSRVSVAVEGILLEDDSHEIVKGTQAATEREEVVPKHPVQQVGKLVVQPYDIEEFAKMIFQRFQNLDFTFQHIIRFFEEEKGIVPNLFTSKEQKEKGTDEDLRSGLFQWLSGASPHLKLEQFYHNESQQPFSLRIDAELDPGYQKRPGSNGHYQREDGNWTGVYFRIVS